MSMEIDLRTYLLAKLPQGAAGVWWLAIPQGTKVGRGLVVLRRIATKRIYTLDGAGGMVVASIQMDCWADRAGDAIGLAGALVQALHALQPHSTMGQTHVHAVRVTAERDIDEPDAGLYRRSLDVEIVYTEVA